MRRLLVAFIVLIAVAGIAYYVLSPVEVRVFAVDAESGNVLWSAAIPAEGSIPNVSAGGERVFVGMSDENERDNEPDNLTLMAFDAQSGSRLWEFKFDPATFGNTWEYTWKYPPLVMQNTVYVALSLHDKELFDLVAIDAESGTLKWMLKERAPVEMAVTVHTAGERLAALLQDETGYRLVFLDPATGEFQNELWHSTPEDQLDYTFKNPYVLGNDQAVYLATRNAVRAYDLSGKELFTIETEEAARIALSETALYVQQSFRGINAHDLLTGEVQWEYKTAGLPAESYLTYFRIAGDTVYSVCQCEGESPDEVWLIAISDGTQQWTKVLTERDPGAWFTTPVTFTDGVAVRSNMNGENNIIAFAAGDGAELWRFKRSIGAVDPDSTDEQVFIIDQAARYNHLFRR